MPKSRVLEIPEESRTIPGRYWLALAGTTAASLVLGLVVGAAVGRVSARVPAVIAEAKRSEEKAQGREWTRDEFRREFKGKTSQEILDILGKPDAVNDSGPGRSGWKYYPKGWKVTEPVTGQPARVVFLYLTESGGTSKVLSESAISFVD